MTRLFTRKEREVWQACEALWEQGLALEKITGEAIGAKLLELGCNRGSNADLYRHKRSWVASKDFDFEKQTVADMPNAVSDRISKAASLLREEVYKEVEEEVTKLKDDAANQLKQFIEQLDLKATEYTLLLKQLEIEQEEFKLLNEKHIQLEAAYKTISTEYAITNEREKLLKVELDLFKIEAVNKMQLLVEQFHLRNNELTAHHQSREAEYQHQISEFKDLMENQRHSWIKIHDDLLTENKKLQLTIQKNAEITQADKSELQSLQIQLKESRVLYSELHAEYKNLKDSLKEQDNELSQIQYKMLQDLIKNQEFNQAKLDHQLDTIIQGQQKLTRFQLKRKRKEPASSN